MAQPVPTPETITQYVQRVAARDRPGVDDEAVFAAASARLLMHLHDTLTLGTRRRAALRLHDEGDLAGAREIQEELVYGATNTLGADDRDALALKSDLGLTLSEQGELGDASVLQRAVLDAYVQRYGDRDSETLQAKLNLATTAKRQGELATALKLEEEVLDVLSTTLGFRHADTAAAAGRVSETRLQLMKVRPPEKKSRSVCEPEEDGTEEKNSRTACDPEEDDTEPCA